VCFLGWQEKEQMVADYQNANLFVNPSRDEGMPNVVLEAMASGLPIVATRIAGSEELVVPGETGLLVPPEDVAAVHAALRELIPDAALRRKMGAAARRRVEQHYTWRSVAKLNLELLGKAAEKK
jgi:glycosyltransferase involved in cell wall biosynthesis